MEVDMDGSARLVPVASDHSGPKQVVMDMARQLGFKPYDAGGLVAAQGVEERVTQLFPEWRLPVAITVVILCLWSVYVAYVYFIGRTVYSWEQIFVKVLNKPVAMTAITVFALTYLPGCLAGFLQLHRGTKHSRFPHWLDAWMRMRKQLGLVAFALACVHVFISAMTLSPTYYHSWFHHVDVTLHRNLTSDVVRLTLPAKSWMTWKGELSCLTGLITLVTFTILALTSIPSVGESLNWSEWRFVQSGLGTFGLLMCVGHTLVMGVPSWLSRNFRILSLLQSVTFTSTLLAVVVLLLKLVLATPCLRGPLRRIRHGWERGSPPISDEESGSNGVTSRDVMSSASTTRTSDLMTSRPYRNGGKHNAGSCCQENGIAMGDVGGGGRGGSDGNENGGYSNSCIEMNEQNVGKGGNTPSR
ncbi:metalloreductase STEAP4-like [Aplysia californica]|uniref:Metalloreductase STEAP4-like n=1 Tax=Aplysia californica TaxID=6500 RepID=A0ABM1W2D1_APLCA|nr:metalloreductase STEAP4-like [Aplysia californica]